MHSSALSYEFMSNHMDRKRHIISYVCCKFMKFVLYRVPYHAFGDNTFGVTIIYMYYLTKLHQTSDHYLMRVRMIQLHRKNVGMCPLGTQSGYEIHCEMEEVR